MKKTVTIALALLLGTLPGWASAAPVASMRGSEVSAEDQAPETKEYLGKRPGMQQKVVRTFVQQPPLIPHAVNNFDEISLEENQCLDCHGPAKFKEKKSPKIGDSHFFDREGNKLADVARLRHNCTQCHVPQADAPPLVENTFVGNVKTATAKTKAKPSAKP